MPTWASIVLTAVLTFSMTAGVASYLMHRQLLKQAAREAAAHDAGGHEVLQDLLGRLRVNGYRLEIRLVPVLGGWRWRVMDADALLDLFSEVPELVGTGMAVTRAQAEAEALAAVAAYGASTFVVTT